MTIENRSAGGTLLLIVDCDGGPPHALTFWCPIGIDPHLPIC
ncbi:MAG TPA: hypothetical protein VEI57_11310 [Nitrospirota bacterium]|nr:hypothetical protein [Nitrospirota bacterium]